MHEVVETLEREQKILAKIACVPGKTAHVAAWMRKFFAIILEVDAKASLRTNTGKIIKRLDDFPVGQKFSDAFKSEQSDDDAKFVKMTFCMTSTPSLSHIKTRHRKLVEHLQLHQMYMDESHSGSDEEELIGYFMGFQAEKTYLVGFSDDLREILTRMILQPGERTMLDEAKKALTWPSDGCHPFYARVRNVTRAHNGSQCTSKAVGITTAKEHSSFFKSLLIRSQQEHKLNGLGRCINTPTDRRFFKAIKWHNDQIEPTSTLPIIGISHFAMPHPLKAHRAGGSGHTITNPRDELIKSGNFSTIHSTKQSFDEGRWILIVANKAKTNEASAFFSELVNPSMEARTARSRPRHEAQPIPFLSSRKNPKRKTDTTLPATYPAPGDPLSPLTIKLRADPDYATCLRPPNDSHEKWWNCPSIRNRLRNFLILTKTPNTIAPGR
jgi:hypothetical protein